MNWLVINFKALFTTSPYLNKSKDGHEPNHDTKFVVIFILFIICLHGPTLINFQKLLKEFVEGSGSL